jgi:dUTP pyrophosphatase
MNIFMDELKVQRVHPDAKLPVYGTAYAAGIDFFTPEEVWLPPGAVTLIPLGVKVSFPHGLVLIFKEKSGIASRSSLIIKSGVIDSDYRGELKVMYHNAGQTPFHFKAGEKVVQGVLLPLAKLAVQEATDLDYTDRNENGFGSTGQF